MTTLAENMFETEAPLPTWFGVGGRADRLARPDSIDALRRALEVDHGAPVRILGDGANLLVADEGVDGLVISLENLKRVEQVERSLFRVGAGAKLPRLVLDAARRGLAGIEGLGGVPATLGGAVRMNAGGAFGQIADVVESVVALDREGRSLALRRNEIDFGYRRSGLEDLIIVEADLRLTPDDPTAVRARLKNVMASKKKSQPLGADSAGCVFKNPEIDGRRESAGRLIDQAGCKEMRVSGASVSTQHANFIVTDNGARAAHVLELIERVREAVHSHCGVTLETEIVIWKRGDVS